MLKLILIFWWKAKEFNLLVSVSIFWRYSQRWDVPYDAAWIWPWSYCFCAGWCTTTFRECCSHLPGRNVYKLDRSQGDNWLAGMFSQPNTLWFRLLYCIVKEAGFPETLTHCRHCGNTSEKKFKKSIGTSSSVKTFATWQRTGVWNVSMKKV